MRFAASLLGTLLLVSTAHAVDIQRFEDGYSVTFRPSTAGDFITSGSGAALPSSGCLMATAPQPMPAGAQVSVAVKMNSTYMPPAAGCRSLGARGPEDFDGPIIDGCQPPQLNQVYKVLDITSGPPDRAHNGESVYLIQDLSPIRSRSIGYSTNARGHLFGFYHILNFGTDWHYTRPTMAPAGPFTVQVCAVQSQWDVQIEAVEIKVVTTAP